MMFCPKCGNQVPDGSAFCGRCGNRFENAATPSSAAPAAGKAAAGSSSPSGPKLAPAGMATVVIALVALVFTFMPWFETSASLQTIGGAASGLASGVSSLLGGPGGVGGSLDFEETYTVWSLVGLADSFKGYADLARSFGASSMAGAAAIVVLFSWACLILWLVSLVLTIWGAIAAFAKGRVGILRTSSILMAITVFVFFVFAALMGDDTGSPTAMPVLCLVLSVAAFCCSFAAKKKA